MQNIGEILRQAREAKGITLEQAEDDTKIRKRYLQALEEGDYGVLPGTVYAKGFLRNYAGYLGLNHEEILIEYKLLNSPVREQNGTRVNIEEAISRRRAGKRQNRLAYLGTAVIAVVAIIIFGAFGMFSEKDTNPVENGEKGNVQTGQSESNGSSGAAKDPKSEPMPQENSQDTPQNQTSGKPTDEPDRVSSSYSSDEQPTPGDEAVKVMLRGKEISWVKVVVDGRVDFTGELKPGETKSFSASEKIKFRLGNAGGVEVSVNGQEIGTLGPIGAVVDKEYAGTGGTAE